MLDEKLCLRIEYQLLNGHKKAIDFRDADYKQNHRHHEKTLLFKSEFDYLLSISRTKTRMTSDKISSVDYVFEVAEVDVEFHKL